MPTDTVRASGNNQYGVMSDAERASFGSQQNAQDWILRKRLQDEALARQEAQVQQGQTAAERIAQMNNAAQLNMNGTFADKTAQRNAELTAMNAPEMAREHFLEEQARQTREDNALARQVAQAQLRAKLAAYGELDGGGTPGATAGADAPGSAPGMVGTAMTAPVTTPGTGAPAVADPRAVRRKQRIQDSLLGLTPDPEDQARAAFDLGNQQNDIQRAREKLQESTDPVEQKQMQAILAKAGYSDTAEMAGAFAPDQATRDTNTNNAINTFKQLPQYQVALNEILSEAKKARNGESDQGQVLAKRDALAKLLIARRVDPQTAVAVINQDLDQKLPGIGRDILSGVSAALANALFRPSPMDNPYENVGAASSLRQRIMGEGYDPGTPKPFSFTPVRAPVGSPAYRP